MCVYGTPVDVSIKKTTTNSHENAHSRVYYIFLPMWLMSTCHVELLIIIPVFLPFTNSLRHRLVQVIIPIVVHGFCYASIAAALRSKAKKVGVAESTSASDAPSHVTSNDGSATVSKVSSGEREMGGEGEREGYGE